MQAAIPAIDPSLTELVKQEINQKTKPLGSLGRLESLATQIALALNLRNPRLAEPQALVFAGDHGAAKAGVSAYPQDVTWQMVENFLAGGAAINVFARQLGLGLQIVDAGVAHDFGARAGLVGAKIAHGTRNYLTEPAMTVAQAELALERGRAIAQECAGGGCNLLALGEMGIGNTASASLLTHCLTGAALDTVVGRGTGLDDAGLARKRRLLADALGRGGRPATPVDALAEYGGFEIAMLAGAIIGGAERRMILLIDGFIVTAAALVAHALAPAVLPYCVFSHRSEEPGHRIQLAHLDARPLLDLGLRLGEGTGAALAVPLAQAAVNFLNEMASFASAGVSRKQD